VTAHQWVDSEPITHCSRCGTVRCGGEGGGSAAYGYRAPGDDTFVSTDPTCDGAMQKFSLDKQAKRNAKREFAREIIDAIDSARSSEASPYDVEFVVTDLLVRGAK
jgi:hypothetical protein